MNISGLIPNADRYRPLLRSHDKNLVLSINNSSDEIILGVTFHSNFSCITHVNNMCIVFVDIIDHTEGIVFVGIIDHAEGIVFVDIIDHAEGIVFVDIIDHAESIVFVGMIMLSIVFVDIIDHEGIVFVDIIDHAEGIVFVVH